MISNSVVVLQLVHRKRSVCLISRISFAWGHLSHHDWGRSPECWNRSWNSWSYRSALGSKYWSLKPLIFDCIRRVINWFIQSITVSAGSASFTLPAWSCASCDVWGSWKRLKQPWGWIALVSCCFWCIPVLRCLWDLEWRTWTPGHFHFYFYLFRLWETSWIRPLLCYGDKRAPYSLWEAQWWRFTIQRLRSLVLHVSGFLLLLLS